MASLNPLRYAIECVKAVEKSFDKKGDVASKFRARARELAESIYYNDLAYVLAYIAAKSGEQYMIDYIQKDPATIAEYIRNERNLSAEEKSYALYGAFLSKYIHSSGALGTELRELDFGTLLVKVQEKSLILSPRVLAVTEWLKRLAEAKFEAE
jgi:CRISPR type III-B/RAMP module-associated protein Cmr5